MPKYHFPFLTTSRRLCSLAGLFLLAQAAGAQDADSWIQHLRIGAPIVFNLRANFSENGTFNLPTSLTGATGVSGVDHIYDDGYVRVDQTGNAQGYTSYWGYQNASQYNPGTQTLTMHSANSYTASGSDSAQGGAFVGFEAAYGTDLWSWGRAHVGWELGAGVLPIRINDSTPLAASINQSVFTFNTGGIVLPTAPYNGGPGGTGPTIHDVATAQAGGIVPGTVTGSRSLDVMLYTLRLGPTVQIDFAPQWGVMAGVGPALGVVSGSYKFNENITATGGATANNSGSIALTKAVYGGYVNGTLLFHAVKNGDLYLGAQFMPLSDAGVSGPGRSAKLDLGGAVQFSVGLNWPF